MLARRLLLLLSLVVLCLLFLLVRDAEGLSQWWRHCFVDAMWALFSLGASVACLLCARRLPTRSLRVAWRLFAAGAFVWFLGILEWSRLELVEGRFNPFPSLGDLCFVCLPLLSMAGMAALRRERRTGPLSLLQASSAGLVMIGAAITITLALAATPSSGSSLGQFLIAANVVLFSADFVFGLHCLVAATGRGAKRVLLPIVLGQGFNLFVVVAYLRAVLDASYAVGGWLDVAFCVVFGLLMVAAQEQSFQVGEGAEQAPADLPTLSLLDSFFPAIALGGCLLASLPYLPNFGLVPPWLLGLEWFLLVCWIALHNLAARQILRDLEASLRSARDRAREAQGLESMSTLAGGLAHDFNNILTIIRGQLYLLRAGAGDLDAAEQAITQGTELTRSLQSLAGKPAGGRKGVPVPPLLTSVSHLIRSVLPPEITIRLEVASELPPVELDPTLIQRALINLALNARDAMPSGGELTLGAALRAHEGGRWLELSVEDTGEGMPPEVAERMFEPYFTTKTEGRGTGLGLTVVAQAARDHQGEARAESSPAGTRVVIAIPVGPVAVPGSPAPAPAGAPSAPRGARALVVDDEPRVREFVAGLLTGAGWEVLESGDGADALAQARAQGPFELVVTDLGLPHIGGLELATRLRDAREDQPIILMSGDSALDSPEAAVFPHRLHKPFEPEQLLACLAQVARAPAAPEPERPRPADANSSAHDSSAPDDRRASP